MSIYIDLRVEVEDNVLPYGALTKTTKKYGVHLRTVSRIWSRAKDYSTTLAAVKALKKRKKGVVGRPRKNIDDVNEAMKASPYSQRGTLRDTAVAIGIPKSTLWDLLKKGDVKRVSNTIKPILTPQNK